MLRAPRARGPYSMRPWNQPHHLPSDSSSATCAQARRSPAARGGRPRDPGTRRARLRRKPAQEASRLRVAKPVRRPRTAETLCQGTAPLPAPRPRRRRGLDPEPGRRSSRAECGRLPTQFSANAARQAEVRRARHLSSVAGHAQHDLLAHGLDGGGEIQSRAESEAPRARAAGPRTGRGSARSSSSGRRRNRSSPCSSGMSRRGAGRSACRR